MQDKIIFKIFNLWNPGICTILENVFYEVYTWLILESKDMHVIFQKKGKKGKKGKNIWKFWQKCTTFENILKKGSLMHASIAHIKQLEYVLICIYLYICIHMDIYTQSLILHKMLTFTGTLSLSRFKENWDVVVTNEFCRVWLKKCNFLNFKLPYF